MTNETPVKPTPPASAARPFDERRRALPADGYLGDILQMILHVCVP